MPPSLLSTLASAPLQMGMGLVTAAEVVVRAPLNAMRQQPLSTLSAEARECAAVSDQCYCYVDKEPRRLSDFTVAQRVLTLDPDFNCELYAVYCTPDGNPILGFTGTRFGTPEQGEDVLPDTDIGVCGCNRLVQENPWIYETVREVARKYGGKRLILTGHSLGGSRALIAAMGGDGTSPDMDVSHFVHLVHVFNPGSGLMPLAWQGNKDKVFATIHLHRIFRDVVSATNFPCQLGGKLNITVYSKHPDTDSCHALDNFCLPAPES
mmetsp:Transcript_101020/g.261592  ORF Transcript_101020/g.261592 Transcript_101020/m.261592 type:complete len:265 (-) Transcript_101020:61-855(-)